MIANVSVVTDSGASSINHVDLSDSIPPKTVLIRLSSPAPPPSYNVLKTDGLGDSYADAYLRKDFVSQLTGQLWLTWDMAFTAASSTYWSTNTGECGSAFLVSGRNNADTFYSLWLGAWPSSPDPFQWNWNAHGSGGNAGTPDAGTWHTFELHVDHTSNDAELFIDTVSLGVASGGGAIDTKQLYLGQFGICNDPTGGENIVYYHDFKAGTTRGASDIMSDLLEGPAVSVDWTATVGSCTFVANPY